jgi:hypothetical protein
MMLDAEARELTPVLMMTPYFAPQTHAAMFRAHKLAKYLPRFGYRPVVVTTDVNYLYNEDQSLLSELDPVVQVHRARYVEPTARGVRMALGGRDRTFSALKGRPVPVDVRSTPAAPSPSSRASLSTELTRVAGEWPDRYWTWAWSARKMCRDLIREQNIPLLYTSAVPVSPLAAAGALQGEFGLKWVADFRDPVGYGAKHSARGPVASLMEQRILQRAVRRADVVTGLASSYGGVFFDLFGLDESRYRFIPTGLDEAYLPRREPEDVDPGMLLHVGEVMPNQSRHAFEVLARAQALAPERLGALRLVFVGRREVNMPRVHAITSTIADWRLPLEFIDHVPQFEVYQLIGRARACLLIPGRNRYWWTNFAKLVDYIAMRAPVIADVPEISEARSELTKAGQGFFVEGVDVDRDAAALVRWLSEATRVADSDYSRRYTALVQAESFARVFDEVLGKRVPA